MSKKRQQKLDEQNLDNDLATLFAGPDDELELLRGLLMDGYESHLQNLTAEIDEVQQEMDKVQDKLDSLDGSLSDEEALLQTINPIIASSIRDKIRDSRPEMIEALSPIMADTIRANIRESKDEMVEALYPLVGQLVQRSVREAINSLASRIDHQIQTRFSFRNIVREFQALVTGVSRAELALRDSLPFDATDLFLIHRETGLLLAYVTDEILDLSPSWAVEEESSLVESEDQLDELTIHGVVEDDDEHNSASHYHYDSDLISGMLTAIRDFVDDTFGQGEGGSLDQVDYGSQKILIETTDYIYMAIVVKGTAPFEFRGTMRNCLMEIQHEFSGILKDYDGDASTFESTKGQLQGMLRESDSPANPSISVSPNKQNSLTKIDDGQTHPSLNSPSLNPLSILLIINAFIFIIWWISS